MNPLRLLKSSSLYLIGNIANRAVGFVMVPLYTRYLSTSDYGILELVELTISLVIMSVGYYAITGSMVRIYYDWKETRERNAVVSSAIITMAVFGIFVTGAADLAAPWLSIALFHSTAQTSFIRYCFLATYIGSLMEPALSYLRLMDRALFFVSFSLVQLTITLGLNIYFIAFAGQGIWSFVLSKLIFCTLGGGFLLFVILREIGAHWRWEPTKRMMVFGAPLILSAVGFFIIHFSDRFFLTRYSTLSEIGIYSLAYKFGFVITYLVAQPFTLVWNVSLYRFLDQEGWREDFARIARFFIFCLFLAGVTMVLFAHELVAIMAAPAFRGAVAVIPVVIAAYVFREVGDFFRNILYIIKDRSLHVGVIAAVCAVLDLGLNFVLIPRAGIVGAAWATLITWLVYMAVIWIAAQRDHRLPYSPRSLAILAGVAIGIWYLGTRTANLPVWQEMGTHALLVAVFIGGSLVCGYFPREDRKALARYASLALAAAKGRVTKTAKAA